MAWHGDDVFRLEDVGLLQNAAPYFRQREPVSGGIESLQASRNLDRLERYAAHAWLPQGKVDDLTDLAIVQPFFERYNQRSGNAKFIQVLQRLLADSAQVSNSRRRTSRQPASIPSTRGKE